MNSSERYQEIERLKKECQVLEEEAGLSKMMERAREGHFIPLETTSSQEYFAFEYDYLRDNTRDAYFSVKDIDIRKRLITERRLIESHYRQWHEEEIIAANRKASTAAEKATHQPWGMAALFGIGAVALGYWVFEIVGAIGGAVAGLFLGQGVIAKSRNEASAELAQASHELEQAQKEKLDSSLNPDFFSHREEISGERDTAIDNESAYINVLQAHKVG